MRKHIDQVRFDEAVKSISACKRYNLYDFMKEHNLLEGSKEQGNNTFISCPHHSDSSPSMSVNFENNIYRCFGCGVGGGYLKFVVEYENSIGNKTNVFSLVSKILKNDLALAQELGFQTVYSEIDKTVDLENIEFTKPVKLKLTKPRSFIELAEKIKKDKRTVEEKLMMVSLMQGGLDVTEVFESIYNHMPKVELNDVNLLDIMGGI